MNVDVGGGVSYRFVSCAHGERSGAIVVFSERDEPDCEGLVSWCQHCDRATWTLHSLEPLTIEPSVQCLQHPEHHGWIREGRWVSA